jgi:hypothetical protein
MLKSVDSDQIIWLESRLRLAGRGDIASKNTICDEIISSRSWPALHDELIKILMDHGRGGDWPFIALIYLAASWAGKPFPSSRVIAHLLRGIPRDGSDAWNQARTLFCREKKWIIRGATTQACTLISCQNW